MSYTSVLAVKQALRVPAAITTHDALIESIVNSIDSDAHRYCGVVGLTLMTRDERMTVDWSTNLIVLRHRPIRQDAGSVLLTNAGAAVASSNFVVDEDAGTLELTNGAKFSTLPGAVQVNYPAGIRANEEGALARAMTAWAVSRFNRSPHLGIKNEAISGSYKYEMDGEFHDPYGDMPPETKGYLDTFRSQVF